MTDEKQFVDLRDIVGVLFKCGCGKSFPISVENLTSESIGEFFAYHTHADDASLATVNEDKAFLNGRLSRFFCEDLKKIAEIADRRKLRFNFEIRDTGRTDGL